MLMLPWWPVELHDFPLQEKSQLKAVTPHQPLAGSSAQLGKAGNRQAMFIYKQLGPQHIHEEWMQAYDLETSES